MMWYVFSFFVFFREIKVTLPQRAFLSCESKSHDMTWPQNRNSSKRSRADEVRWSTPDSEYMFPVLFMELCFVTKTSTRVFTAHCPTKP